MLRLFTGLALLVAPAAAVAATYAATPVTRAAQGRIISSDISWTCGPDACLGSADYGRPLVLCQGLASRTGRLASFVADGRAFSPSELDRCNARAKGSAPVASAR